MASSIHIEEVKTASFAHNDRSMKVSYLIDDSSRNYCSCSADAAAAKFHELKDQAAENYKKNIGQNLQKSTKFLKEAIVNLEAHHTEKDLKPIIEKLESYGYTVLQVAIHRDEGFKSADTNEKKYNYHAHITLFNLDVQTGKSIKFGKNYRTELSRLQTFTADTLKMERGKCSDETHAQEIQKEYNAKQTRRLGTHEFKRKAKEEELKVLAKQKELNGQIEDLRKELIASKSASKEDYRVLKEEKERLKEQVKNKDLTIQQLHERIKNLKVDLLEEEAEVKELVTQINHLKANPVKVEVMKVVEKVVHIEDTTKIKQLKAENLDLLTQNQSLQADKSMLQNQNKALKTQNLSLNDKILDLTNKTLSRPNMSDYEPKYKSLMTDIKKFNEDLEAKQTTPKGVFDWVKSQFTALKEQLKALKDQVMALGNQQLRLVHLLKVQANQTATLDQQMEIQMLITGKTKDELVKEAQKAQEPKERRITMEDLKQLNEDMKKERDKLQSKSKGYEL